MLWQISSAFCSYASSVGAVNAFANAVYIFANIGANAEILAFAFCDNLSLNAVANLA